MDFAMKFNDQDFAGLGLLSNFNIGTFLVFGSEALLMRIEAKFINLIFLW
jgi:hypothetical protein